MAERICPGVVVIKSPLVLDSIVAPPIDDVSPNELVGLEFAGFVIVSMNITITLD